MNKVESSKKRVLVFYVYFKEEMIKITLPLEKNGTKYIFHKQNLGI